MSELASIETEQLRGLVVARIAGEIDASNAASIQARLLDAIGNEDAGLVVDLTATDYVDSAGIRVLFDNGERLKVRGMELRVVTPPESFTADVLSTVRMADRFAVDDELDAAVAAIAAGRPTRPATE